jgi:hypothetical protein
MAPGVGVQDALEAFKPHSFFSYSTGGRAWGHPVALKTLRGPRIREVGFEDACKSYEALQRVGIWLEVASRDSAASHS